MLNLWLDDISLWSDSLQSEKWILDVVLTQFSDKYDLSSMDKNEIIDGLYHRDGVTPLTLGDAANALKKSWKAYKIAGHKGEPKGDIAYRIYIYNKA